MSLRNLQRVAHRQADAMSERLRQAGPRPVICTVETVTAGAAGDNNALVTVTWRGEPQTVAGYASSYTPAVGHRVLCHIVNDQLVVAFRIVGYPATT